MEGHFHSVILLVLLDITRVTYPDWTEQPILWQWNLIIGAVSTEY